MRFRLLALIALVFGLSRLALSAETQFVRFETIKREVIKQKTKAHMKKRMWSGSRRVTRRRLNQRPRSIGIPVTLPPAALPIASTDFSVGLPQLSTLPEPKAPNFEQVRLEAASTAAVAGPSIPRPGYWSADRIAAGFQSQLAARGTGFGDPRFLHDHPLRAQVTFRL